MIHLPWDCLGKQHFSCTWDFQSLTSTVLESSSVFHDMHFRLQSMNITWPIYGGQHAWSRGEEDSPDCLWMYVCMHACMHAVCSTCLVMHVSASVLLSRIVEPCLFLCPDITKTKTFFLLLILLVCLRDDMNSEGLFILFKDIQPGRCLQSLGILVEWHLPNHETTRVLYCFSIKYKKINHRNTPRTQEYKYPKF